ncbi:MAG: hypothetical protein ABJZ74_17110, partial [Nitratireductor sp.]
MTEISGLATALPLANARLERRDGDPTNDAFSGILQRGQNKHSEPRDGTDRPEDKDDTAMEERQPAPAAQADGAARRQRPPVPLEGQFVLLRHPGLSLRTAGEGEGENSAVTRDGQEEENQPSGDETEAAAATAATAAVTAAVLPLAP